MQNNDLVCYVKLGFGCDVIIQPISFVCSKKEKRIKLQSPLLHEECYTICIYDEKETLGLDRQDSLLLYSKKFILLEGQKIYILS